MVGIDVTRRLSGLRPARRGTIARLLRHALVIGGCLGVTASFAQAPPPGEVEPNIDLYALMSGS